MSKIQDKLRGDKPTFILNDEAADLLDECAAALRPFAEFAQMFPTSGPPVGGRPKEGAIYIVSRMIDGRPVDAEFTVEAVHAAATVLAKLEGKP